MTKRGSIGEPEPGGDFVVIVDAIQVLKQGLRTLIENTLDGGRFGYRLISLAPLRGQVLQRGGDFFRNRPRQERDARGPSFSE